MNELNGISYSRNQLPMMMAVIGIVSLLVLLNISVVYAQEDLDKSVQFLHTRIKFKELLRSIEEQSTLHFSFDPENIPSETVVHLPAQRMTLKSILELLHRKHNINHSKVDNVIILKVSKKKSKNTVTVNGIVTDVASGELLPGAQIVLPEFPKGTTTNAYGFYSLTHNSDRAETVQVRHMGYKNAAFRFSFTKDSTVNVSLDPDVILLSSVTVSADQTEATEIQQSSGTFTLSAAKVKDVAAFAGEPDPLKSLHFLPGVQSSNEGTANLSVRGGSSDQNLFLMDEAPVYNPSHALSFFSIFNADALQSITLYKSDIPVTYGGRLSSVVSVRTKEGNRVKRTYSGAVGTIASRLSIEGPFSKKNDKASFIVSGRYSYAGAVVNGIYEVGSFIFNDPTANISTTNNKIGFYDLNAKVNYRKDQRNHFYLSAYSGHDNFHFNHITNGYALAWGNKTATFRWNRVHNPRMFSNTTAVYSKYNYEYKILNNTQYFLWRADFNELSIKQDFDYYFDLRNHITFGGGIEAHWIMPGEVKPRSSTAITRTYSLQKQYPTGAFLYIANEETLGEKITLKYGLRYSNFILTGPNTRFFFHQGQDKPHDSITYSRGELEKIYHRIDPRAAISLKTGKGLITASYDHTTQYFHLLANSSVGLPTDIWMPSGGNIKPQSADIYAITCQYPVSRSLAGSAGTFYKQLNNILDFKDNADLFVNRYVESQLLQGTGNSYGAEFFLQKNYGKFRGSASYTWSKTTHRIIGVNQNREFAPRYDKRHNLSFTGKSEWSKQWETSFNYVYTTGGALTVPTGNFTFDGAVFNSYSERNSFRLPNYHRMDISVRYSSRKNDHRSFKSYWSFDVYNVYGRKNPFTIYSQQEDNGFVKTRTSAIYLFKIVPSITYNFKF